ncbi:MAG: ferrous iron transport protein B [Planctomycetaceae bacterium]|nr:ferrous iron transport protein B [Planctomycetaceae bacterium]
MTLSAPTRTFTVALVGNPNTGKSTLFSGLVGVHQRVGNYPGVTVEKKTGQMEIDGRPFEIIDLPGLYSLAARSRDEMVAVDLLLGRRSEVGVVDAVLCLVDASNLERNLYLVSQVLELGLPAVLAINMLDVAERHGVRINLEKLRQRLGVPIVAVQANRRIGLTQLRAALASVEAQSRVAASTTANREPAKEMPCRACRCDMTFLTGKRCSGAASGDEEPCAQPLGRTPLPEAFEHEVTSLESELVAESRLSNADPPPRCLVRRLLLDRSGCLQRALLAEADTRWANRIEAAQARLAAAGYSVPSVETTARYDWARRVLDGVVVEPRSYRATTSDRIDRVLTHRVWGTAIFAVVMVTVFQSVFVWARPATQWIQSLTTAASDYLTVHMAEGAWRSLLVDGALTGVGAILAFLPQIVILFGFLALLEDCGYMARAAFLMDRLMVRVGLSGKSFIPLLSSFGCAVPGIMAARVIEDERDRLTTILIAPLVTCPARLQVYALLIAAFIPTQAYLGGLLNLQGLTLAGLYVLGILAAVLCAMLFKRTILRGRTPPFMMELPSYKWPSPQTVLLRMAERGCIFLRTAGTLILGVSILIWAALYFPHDPTATHQEQQRDSCLGRAGRIIEPAVRPLGWDWRIGCAVIGSLPARELVVANLGVMYHLNDEQSDSDTQNARWHEKLHAVTWDGTDRRVYSVPVALGIMVFFALCAQCMPTLAVIRRETNSWRWPAFTFAYMTGLAYVAALVTYQVGTWVGNVWCVG